MTSSNRNSPGPLDGVRVLEFGQIAAGPFAGSLLADLGADVVKIERPDGGDGMRGWPPLTRGEGGDVYSENFASLNRNKRSATLDLKDADEIARLKRVAANADVVVENFRPGVLGRLGLGYEAIRALNPASVYCSISGYGQAGPYAGKGAFDVTVQGMSGLMSVTGEDGADPVKCGVPVADFCAGLYAAYTISAALLAARESGEGRHIDCSMLGALLGVAALQTSEYFGTGAIPRRRGSAHPRNAPYQAFAASDDHFVIAAGNDRLWHEVAQAAGLPELVDDARFVTQNDRARHQEALVALLAERFAKRSAAEWLEIMDARGVPCAPIQDYAQVLDEDLQVRSMNLVRPLTLPNGATTRTVAFPIPMSGYEFEIRREPPALGADTAAVLEEWQSPSSRQTRRARP